MYNYQTHQTVTVFEITLQDIHIGSVYLTLRLYWTYLSTYRVIQEESSVLWEVIVLVIVKNKVHMNIFLILNGYRVTAVWISLPNSFTFLFVGLDDAKFTKQHDTRDELLARSHFGCCGLHKEAWRSTEKNNTRSSHTSCKSALVLTTH